MADIIYLDRINHRKQKRPYNSRSSELEETDTPEPQIRISLSAISGNLTEEQARKTLRHHIDYSEKHLNWDDE